MAAKLINAADAKKLLTKGQASLVDIRGADEYAREHIEGALSLPLDQLAAGKIPSEPAIFHCRSGNRTAICDEQLTAATNSDCYILDGGLDAWKANGLPTLIDRSQPLEIMRQVQIAAGLLVLIGILLGTMVAAPFYAIAAFVGAGLTFAGSTGWCGMAKLLGLMPWNRRMIG